MIPCVVASDSGFLAKLYACDTRQGLRVRGCGAKLFTSTAVGVRVCVVLVEVAWSGLPEKVMSPVHEGAACVCWFGSRVAAGSWSLL